MRKSAAYTSRRALATGAPTISPSATATAERQATETASVQLMQPVVVALRVTQADIHIRGSSRSHMPATRRGQRSRFGSSRPRSRHAAAQRTSHTAFVIALLPRANFLRGQSIRHNAALSAGEGAESADPRSTARNSLVTTLHSLSRALACQSLAFHVSVVCSPGEPLG
jgi:hypothetical protein